MNASKTSCGMIVSAITAVAALSVASSALAAPMDARSTTKVNNAMAQKWSQSGQAQQQAAINPAQQNKQVVNIGSKKNNTCNLNVGTVQQAPKGQQKYGSQKKQEIIVTSKDVINVCK